MYKSLYTVIAQQDQIRKCSMLWKFHSYSNLPISVSFEFVLPAEGFAASGALEGFFARVGASMSALQRGT